MAEKFNKKYLKELFFHISKIRKIQFFYLLIFTILVGILEMLTIASVVPFVKSVTDESFLIENSYYMKFFAYRSKEDGAIIAGMIFAGLSLFCAVARSVLIYVNSKFSHVVTAELSVKLFKAKLFEPYSSHIKKSSSNIISIVTQKINQIYGTLSAIINFFSSCFILTCLVVVLVWINPVVTLFAFIFFGVLYFLITILSKKTTIRNSKIINKQQDEIVVTLQNGLGAIRDIVLDKAQIFYLSFFEKAALVKARRQAINEFIQFSPRYIFEGMGILLMIVSFFYWSSSQGNMAGALKILPTLAALALGSQRVIPLLNNLYVNFITARTSAYQIGEVVTILNEDLNNQEKRKLIESKFIYFNNSIYFDNVSFSYENSKKYILENVSLEIKKGSKIGILGKSGEGKSTFLDLLMGLLEPESGSIYIDGVKLSLETISSWQSKLSHVPQKIFLSDTTFRENIAFGVNDKNIDQTKLELAAKKAQLEKFIMGLENKYQDRVGERGVRLSGGQTQRVGLARALYKSSEVIIFDEATNSLDSYTEELILNELNNLDENLTIIIVAHRLNTLKYCDVVYEVKDRKILKIQDFKGSY